MRSKHNCKTRRPRRFDECWFPRSALRLEARTDQVSSRPYSPPPPAPPGWITRSSPGMRLASSPPYPCSPTNDGAFPHSRKLENACMLPEISQDVWEPSFREISISTPLSWSYCNVMQLCCFHIFYGFQILEYAKYIISSVNFSRTTLQSKKNPEQSILVNREIINFHVLFDKDFWMTHDQIVQNHKITGNPYFEIKHLWFCTLMLD